MGLDIKTTDISISLRLPQNTTSYSFCLRSRERNKPNIVSQFPAVIAKFTRRETKDLFHQRRGQLSDKFTKDLGLGRLSDNRIYIPT